MPLGPEEPLEVGAFAKHSERRGHEPRGGVLTGTEQEFRKANRNRQLGFGPVLEARVGKL